MEDYFFRDEREETELSSRLEADPANIRPEWEVGGCLLQGITPPFSVGGSPRRLRRV